MSALRKNKQLACITRRGFKGRSSGRACLIHLQRGGAPFLTFFLVAPSSEGMRAAARMLWLTCGGGGIPRRDDDDDDDDDESSSSSSEKPSMSLTSVMAACVYLSPARALCAVAENRAGADGAARCVRVQ